MTPRDEISLRQMLDHAREAGQLAADRARIDLDTDRLFNLAMTRLLEVVGEAAGRVSRKEPATSIHRLPGSKSSACALA